VLEAAVYREAPGSDSDVADIFAVGLPGSALKVLVVASGAATRAGHSTPGADRLLQDVEAHPARVRLRALSRSEQITAALNDFATEAAAGPLLDEYRAFELGVGMESRSDDVAGIEAPSAEIGEIQAGDTESTPAAGVARSAASPVKQRPVEAGHLRAAPEDDAGRVSGMYDATLDSNEQVAAEALGAERPVTDPAMVFVADVAYAVFPPEPDAEQPTSAAATEASPIESLITGSASREQPKPPYPQWGAIPVATGAEAIAWRDQYEEAWAVGEPATLHIPPLSELFNTFRDVLGSDYTDLFYDALVVSDASVRGVRQQGTVLATITSGERPRFRISELLVVVGALTGAHHLTLVDAVDSAGLFSSRSPLDDALDRLREAGVVDTEADKAAVSESGGRPPNQLYLSDPQLQGPTIGETLRAVAERLQAAAETS